MISHKIQAAFATGGKSNSYFEDFSSNQFTIKNLDDSIQFHEIFTKKGCFAMSFINSIYYFSRNFINKLQIL